MKNKKKKDFKALLKLHYTFIHTYFKEVKEVI